MKFRKEIDILIVIFRRGCDKFRKENEEIYYYNFKEKVLPGGGNGMKN